LKNACTYGEIRFMGAIPPAVGNALSRRERRRWRMLRLRAMTGSLPGAVTELAAYQQRLLARIALVLAVPIGVALLAIAALMAWQVARAGGETHLVAVRVQRVLAPHTWQPARLPYAVRGADGYVYDFASPPRLRPGDQFYAKYDSRNRYLGTVVRGQFSQARSYGRGPILPLVVVLVGFFVLTTVLGSLALLSRRRARGLLEDLDARPVETTGVYEGSWVAPSLAIRTPLARAFQLPIGFPVVVRELATGQRLPELKRFETALAAGDRIVTVAYRPRSGVIDSLSSRDAGKLDLNSRSPDGSAVAAAGIVFAP
jgi:hypothetical protein